MSSSNVGLVMRAWFRWKALRLPWRKRFLVAPWLTTSLPINQAPTFQATPTGSSASPAAPLPPPLPIFPPTSPRPTTRAGGASSNTRARRTSRTSTSRRSGTSGSGTSARTPPTISEQQGDVLRLARMKVLAAEADARWAAKPSFLDQPEQQPKRAVRDVPEPVATDGGAMAAQGGKETVTEEVKKELEKDDPWKKAATGPSEDWQPAAWSPSNSRKR
ncbi:hypothetical protein PG996_000177 [Apiospora saccharicola]|uniref:Uncharacterized protein n=1 Tax=Apiospora saccharicola TaxID=335842 RepID=A0ABR1WFU6_9PEZI